MSAAFTPGPWFADGSVIRKRRAGVGSSMIARTQESFFMEVAGDCQANASLMAAAPELLAALIEMVAGDAEAIAEAEAIGVPFPSEMLATYIKACAAIAKATGGQP